MKKLSKLIRQGTSAEILNDLHDILEQISLSDDEKARFNTVAEKILRSCDERLGEGKIYRFILRKHLSHLELRIGYSGEHFNPTTSLEASPQDLKEKLLSRLPNSRSTTTSFLALADKNIVTIRSPQLLGKKNALQDPIILAILLGISCGFLCSLLPANASSFIVNNLTRPIFSLYSKMSNALMGPILFFSLIVSISTMESLTQLNSMGLKIFGRFVMILLGVLLITGGISLLFFHNFTTGATLFSLEGIFELLFKIFPTNILSPFLDNNYSQLMIIALGFGASALVLKERSEKMVSFAHEARQCLSALWGFVRKLLPLTPFLGMFNLVADNKFSEIFQAWKFIAACYVIFTLCTIFKLIKASLHMKISPTVFLRKLKPALRLGFTTANFSSTYALRRKLAVEEYGIEPVFSDFWTSLSMSLFDFSLQIYLIPAILFLSELYGIPVSLAFFATLAFTSLQLALASPGVTASCTVTFEQFGLQIDNVGLITTCKLLVVNYSVMCSILVTDLEQIESAYIHHAIDLEKLKS